MKKFLGIAMMATVIGVAVAGGKTRLLTPEYDFGVLQEDQGAVTGSAFVVNDGPDTTYVRDVRPSCGCTGAEYSREPLAPGDTTEVWFTYNPVGRPGTIGKTVKIYMGDDDSRHTVRLLGRVVGSELTLRRSYPVNCGEMRLTDSIIEVGRLPENSGRHAFLRIINATADTVTPRYECDNRAVAVDIRPERLVPGDIGTFGIYLNTKFTDTIGPVAIPLRVWADGDTARAATLSIRAVIEPESDDSGEIRKPL
ncbi:DUF1573 domain-containing protein [bacterium]|nr:DUF1573 domain-containing protein [bacterium]MDE7508571.1 DUF1573 domain-containing protein [Muribaculaceae bacterium]